MAVLTITPSLVEIASSTRPRTYQAGELINAGSPVYLDSTTNKVMIADAASATGNVAIGIALTNASADEDYIVVADSGSITTGATMTKGQLYYLGDAGKIQEFSDIIATEYVTALYRATSTSVAELEINVTEIVL